MSSIHIEDLLGKHVLLLLGLLLDLMLMLPLPLLLSHLLLMHLSRNLL
jgi:hypothetical protein